MVEYHYDANSILGIPIKNRIVVSMVNGCKELHNKYELAGVSPSTYILDHDTSDELKELLNM